MPRVASVVRIHARTFTEAEQVIDELSTMILSCGKSYRQLGEEIGVSQTTIAKVATRQTKWPRPGTLFPLMAHFGAAFQFKRVARDDGR